MANLEAMRMRNREVSILFMQQEHAATLKGLHQEIEKLQKRCSELQFKLAMESTYTSQEDELRVKCEQLEKQNAMQKKQLSEKDEQINKREARIDNFEQQIRAIEKKYKDELNNKQSNIDKLENDLAEKCDQIAKLQIAPLTTRTIPRFNEHTPVKPVRQCNARDKHNVDQYLDQSIDNSHPMSSGELLLSGKLISANTSAPKIRSHVAAVRSKPSLAKESLRMSRESSSGSSRPDSSSDEMRYSVPTRPVNASSNDYTLTRRRRTSAPKTPPNLGEVKHRPASARKLLPDSSPNVDTDDILRIAREQQRDFGAGKVIPPIRPISDELANASIQGRSQPNSGAFPRKTKLNQQFEVVETLAVDQVLNKNLRKAQEYNSYGSDG